jgi:hypothetical protein
MMAMCEGRMCTSNSNYRALTKSLRSSFDPRPYGSLQREECYSVFRLGEVSD